jgi:hypothetical protein
MRARSLKPGFFKNEVLGTLPFPARILFLGLACLADREGRLEDRPDRIKAEVFPYDNVDVGALLERLRRSLFIQRYRVRGQDLILVVKFARHQSPHHTEKSSTLPPPKAHAGRTVNSRKSNGGNPPDSLTPYSLTPDSLTPDSVGGAGFEDWSKGYPRKDARQDAERAWGKLTEAERLECVKETPAWLQAKAGTERRFLPLPATYLNGRRWQDELQDPTEKIGASDGVRWCSSCNQQEATPDGKFCSACTEMMATGLCPRCKGPNPWRVSECRDCYTGAHPETPPDVLADMYPTSGAPS